MSGETLVNLGDKHLENTGSDGVLSRRKPGFESPWGRQS